MVAAEASEPAGAMCAGKRGEKDKTEVKCKSKQKPQVIPSRMEEIKVVSRGTAEVARAVDVCLRCPYTARMQARGARRGTESCRYLRNEKMWEPFKKLLSSPRELCLIYACEYADSFSSFALDYVFVLYLSVGFGLSDVAASWIYGVYGLMCLFFGVFFGPLVDLLGVRRSLLLGTATSFAARLLLVFATDSLTLFAALLALLPMGVSLTSNVLKLAVRRYASAGTRSCAFDCSWVFVFFHFCKTSQVPAEARGGTGTCSELFFAFFSFV